MKRRSPSPRVLILSIAVLGATAAVIAGRRALGRERGSAEPQGELRDLWTRVEGVRIYARASRGASTDRLPVVLVHGFGVSSSYMVPIARRLAAEMPVYALDFPGHGRSDDSGRTFTVPELAELLRAWMDVVGIAQAAFLGNSLGCQILAELAVRHPERIERLILTSPTADPEARTFHQSLLRLLATSRAERLSLVPLLVKDYTRAGPRRLLREMRSMFADRIEDKLPRIAVPALVVRGERDAIVPQRWAEEVDRRLGARGVRVIPRAGHALNHSAADELMRVIGPFLRGEAQAGVRGLR